jgi:acyl-CoA thioester hydrolase
MRFELPENITLNFQMVIPVRWGDMDAMGHVNNTVYFRYLESLRIEWMRTTCGQAYPEGQGPVIVNAFCNFIRQITYPGDLLAKHYAVAPGRSSVDTYSTLERTDQPGVIHASGGATVVWVDFNAQKSLPLPDWLRASLPKA